MIDPTQAQNVLNQLMSQSGGGGADLEARTRHGRLVYAASRYADKSGCECEACQLLREAVDLLIGDIKTEVKSPNAGSRKRS